MSPISFAGANQSESDENKLENLGNVAGLGSHSFFRLFLFVSEGFEASGQLPAG